MKTSEEYEGGKVFETSYFMLHSSRLLLHTLV
jgi:hypothetical protein